MKIGIKIKSSFQRPANSWFQSGQTIIEVLIATVVVATILTAIAAGLTLSLKTTSQNKARSLATGYAQESLELYRQQRHLLGWESFYQAVESGGYCFNSLPESSSEFVNLSPAACPQGETIAGTSYRRSCQVVKDGDQVQVESVVTWSDGTQDHEVRLEQAYRDIER